MKGNKGLVSAIVATKDRREDVIECVESLFNSDYTPLEVIVVDDASRVPVSRWLHKKYPKAKIVRNKKSIGAAAARNIGIENAKGDYLLFIDDDAKADKNMIKNLVGVLEKRNKAGIVQPKVLDKEKPNILQGTGHGINLLTGRVYAWGVREENLGQYDRTREIPLAGCVWMAKRQVIEKIGGYDEDYFIPYEDSDFSQRARKEGFEVYCVGNASAWHRGPKRTYVNKFVEWIGITSPERAFRVARNKLIFLSKHSPPINLFIFLLFFLPFYLVIHSLLIVFSGRFDILKSYILGLISGLNYAIKMINKRLDGVIYPVILRLMMWTEPAVWLIDKSAKSVLDVGCGQGLPMQLIKMRIRLKKTVGVDLFEPYIREAKEKGIHDEYVISDVRDLPFKNNSFDVVIALQVLEHLPKKDAWKVLEKMEAIAKKQVIVATPIGEMYHPAVDDNPLQLHKSSFIPKEFKAKGYKILKMGRASMLGEFGIVHKIKVGLLKKAIFAVNFLLAPVFYLFQGLADYHLYAYKSIKKDS